MIPDGHRELTPLDNFHTLNAQGLVLGLCKCGHLERNHGTYQRCLAASCECARFTWGLWVVKK